MLTRLSRAGEAASLERIRFWRSLDALHASFPGLAVIFAWDCRPESAGSARGGCRRAIPCPPVAIKSRPVDLMPVTRAHHCFRPPAIKAEIKPRSVCRVTPGFSGVAFAKPHWSSRRFCTCQRQLGATGGRQPNAAAGVSPARSSPPVIAYRRRKNWTRLRTPRLLQRHHSVVTRGPRRRDRRTHRDFVANWNRWRWPSSGCGEAVAPAAANSPSTRASDPLNFVLPI